MAPQALQKTELVGTGMTSKGLVGIGRPVRFIVEEDREEGTLMRIHIGYVHIYIGVEVVKCITQAIEGREEK